MKLKISAIGKLKSGPERELFDRYIKRARVSGAQLGFPNIAISEFGESAAPTVPLRKQQEAARLLPTGAGMALCFDEHGKHLSSPEFSRFLATERDNGTSELNLILGGPDGLSPEILNKAKICVSFGKMTWPHQIARILLAEQLYRAMTILSGHPYHRT